MILGFKNLVKIQSVIYKYLKVKLLFFLLSKSLDGSFFLLFSFLLIFLPIQISQQNVCQEKKNAYMSIGKYRMWEIFNFEEDEWISRNGY